MINTFNPAAALSATNKLVEGKLTVTVWNKAGVAAKTIEVPYSNAPAQIKSLSWKVKSIVANNAGKDYEEDAAEEIKLANTTAAGAKATWDDETLTIYDSNDGNAADAYGEPMPTESMIKILIGGA